MTPCKKRKKLGVLGMQFIAVTLFPEILKKTDDGRVYFSEKDFKKRWKERQRNDC